MRKKFKLNVSLSKKLNTEKHSCAGNEEQNLEGIQKISST